MSIRALKRVACESAEQQTAAALSVVASLRDSLRSRDCAGLEELATLGALYARGDLPRGDGQEIGIVGSGPAGLAAAHDLALLGFAPVVYAMEDVPAGMLYLGVPE